MLMDILELQDYRIYVGPVWESLDRFFSGHHYSRCLVLVDANTRECCLPQLRKVLPLGDEDVIEIPPGEQHKNLDTCSDIWQRLLAEGTDRKALLINLGGGVIGDMGGFCASTFKRGIDFLQIPTTLLSQVDASIGGKLGIDFGQVKNSIGVFRNPQAVCIDPAFLSSLPPRELRSGFAEIIKHSLIADRRQWKQIREISDLDSVHWPSLIVPSLRIKQRIVEADPFEKGLRKALNFGHTIGHAVESLALETDAPLLHGEAIAIGMICEAWLSARQTGLPEDELSDIVRFLKRIYPLGPLREQDFGEYLRLMGNDKKNENQSLNFSLIGPAGTVHINQTAPAEAIADSLRFYNAV